jgi:thiol:disulfide interchange protein DsbD
MGGEPGVAVIFEGTDDLHYYAKAETAPAASLELKVEAKSDDFRFGQALFPKWQIFTDPIGNGSKVEVYAGHFTVFVPMKAETDTAPTKTAAIDQAKVKVKISGIACTSMVCLPPFEKTLQARFDWSQRNSWKEISIETPGDADEPIEAVKGPGYSAWFALGLAFFAGLILNIMPCVLPVIPLKVLSIFEQAKESKARCIALGLSFCLGILLFFAALATLNIVLQLGYGTVFQWGDHFRNPVFIIAMSLLLVVLALFMFDVFTIIVPSSIAGKAGPTKGLAGSVAMGFLAAVLSTPCSFAILTAAFAWAQTQKLPLATIAIMLIGVGMASPYAILTSMPSLLKYLPKAGRWTELFKQTMGFVLLIVAVWLITALPALRRDSVLYFAVILGFCVWMWGGWVNLTTPRVRRRVIRIVAVVIAVTAGAWLLPEPKMAEIDWHGYDRALIDQTVAEHKPVLIEFMADWCLTCKAVEKTVYAREDIAELIKRKGVLPVKADTTLADSPATIDLKEIYNEPAVPVSILLLPQQSEPARLHGLLIGSTLKDLLQDLPDKG